MQKIYGFIRDEVQPEDYIFGGSDIPDEILQPSGQWDEFLPADEFQYRNGLDTSNCTAYATENAIEILQKRKFGADYNYSERYLGVMAGTYPPGNSPHKVAETIRKESGLIKDSLLPFSESITTIDQYYSPKPMKPDLISEGLKWLDQFLFKHEWVFNGADSHKKEKLKEALKRSPLGVSVYAWLYENGYYVKPKGYSDNHWVVLYGYEEGKYWKVFDQYDSTHKLLAWDFDFEVAKRYWVERKMTIPEITEQLSLIQIAVNRIVEILSKWFPKLGRKITT